MNDFLCLAPQVVVPQRPSLYYTSFYRVHRMLEMRERFLAVQAEKKTATASFSELMAKNSAAHTPKKAPRFQSLTIPTGTPALSQKSAVLQNLPHKIVIKG